MHRRSERSTPHQKRRKPRARRVLGHCLICHSIGQTTQAGCPQPTDSKTHKAPATDSTATCPTANAAVTGSKSSPTLKPRGADYEYGNPSRASRCLSHAPQPISRSGVGLFAPCTPRKIEATGRSRGFAPAPAPGRALCNHPHSLPESGARCQPGTSPRSAHGCTTPPFFRVTKTSP